MPERGRLPALLIWLALAPAASADIYTWKDADGHVHFSDRAVKGAQPHATSDISTVGNPAFNMRGMRMQVPFRIRHGAMVVQGAVNGIGMSFIVDTGASLVVIPPALAARAGIDVRDAPGVVLQTANGQVAAPRVSLDEVKVGHLRRNRIEAVVQRVSSDAGTGLLGMSFLGAYRLTVDHQRRVLLLEPR